jgi:CubicO group peptidase (beta-lactamase class C family)
VKIWSLTFFFPLRYSLHELVQKAAQLPLVAQSGTTWYYSLAHDILGYLIEVISGKPFDVFLRERIFTPLGMEDTGFFVPQVKLYRFGPLYSGPGENGLSLIDGVTISPFNRPNAVPSGGGGIVSSMTDYWRFLFMLVYGGLGGARVLQENTVKAMTTIQLIGPVFPVRFDSE